MEDIKITQTLKSEELNCPVCFNSLNKQIYQCTNGPHFVCGECIKNLTGCPTCRNTTKPVRNIFLEEQLKPHLISCSNKENGCVEKILPWDKEHIKTCKFKPIDCKLCKKQTSGTRDKFVSHLTDCCNMPFVITESVKKHNTYTLTTKYKNTIVPLEKFIAIISRDKETMCHKMAIITDDEKIIGKKVKCSITTPVSSFHIIITISEIDKLSLDSDIPMQLGNSFVFEEYVPNNKTSSNTTNSSNSQTPYVDMRDYLRRSNNTTTGHTSDEQPPGCAQQ
ncbi:MAG: E3 ubiquitin-protein ligase Siah2 [Terrestrivirus sp.]|uniref:E3 ubiquitin-protein ligase Siah2 n=1 Tax=Terrestrivirus sp. TaxID=2487775 RepID=A0A3G4ZQL1_9VIRU|nr:MAG: E3 ubiquitin-protein ligase Siah2 [Terrestrivirus sp.]